MRDEVISAADFLTNMLRVTMASRDSNYNLDFQQLTQFKCSLQTMLQTHYQEHWFPQNPNKGSGYRCIRINHKMDPIISKAGFECGFAEDALRHMFPDELTMWVDPREVSYRIGENGSICILYDGSIATPKRRTTPSMNCSRNSTFSDADDTCSPMSISPPSPSYERLSTCKGEFRFGNHEFLMESGLEYVAS